MANKKSDPRHRMNAERTGGSFEGKVVDIAKPKPRPPVPKNKMNLMTGKYCK